MVDEDTIAERMRAREEEVTLGRRAKQAELELLGAVLVLRDRQIEEMQRMCEAKRAHIRQLQQSDETLPQDPCTSWADVEHLRDKVFSMQSAVECKREELRSLAEVLEEK